MATRIREKAAARKANKDKRPFAIAKDIRITPAKAAIVLDLVRGKNVQAAIAILENSANASAIVIKKTINSAIANAENNKNLPKDNLFVAECFANAGTTMKRLNPRAKGTGNIILKRTCHITIILDTKEEAATPAKAKKPAAAAKSTPVETASKPAAAKAPAKAPAKKPVAKKA